MDNMNNSNMTTENAADFSELIRSIKKISAIVVVDDVRKLTSEDMKKIHEDLEKKGNGKNNDEGEPNGNNDEI